MAAFNGARWIADQLESIQRQENVQVRVVIRDDGSTDDTWRRLQALADGDRVRVSASAMPSGSASQNFFSLIRDNSAAGFDFVALADQDDLWEPDKLHRACCALAEHRAVGYSSATRAFWPDGRERILRQVVRPTRSDFLFEGCGQGCTFVMTAEFYERARACLLAHGELTRPLHYHDWTLYALARVWSLPWTFDTSPSVRYRQHSANDTGARASLAGVMRRLQLMKEGWYGRQLRAIVNMCAAAAPADRLVSRWHSLLASPQGLRRRLRIAGFCLSGGRRRTSDRAVLILAAVAGWI